MGEGGNMRNVCQLTLQETDRITGLLFSFAKQPCWFTKRKKTNMKEQTTPTIIVKVFQNKIYFGDMDGFGLSCKSQLTFGQFCHLMVCFFFGITNVLHF